MDRINNKGGASDIESVKLYGRAEGVRKPAAAPAADTADAAPAKGADQVRLSDAVANVARLTGKANELPDVRQERVEALRKLVESGDYRTDAATLADAILKEEGQ